MISSDGEMNFQTHSPLSVVIQYEMQWKVLISLRHWFWNWPLNKGMDECSRLPCYVFCICLLTFKYQKYKSVELGDHLGWVSLSNQSKTPLLPFFQLKTSDLPNRGNIHFDNVLQHTWYLPHSVHDILYLYFTCDRGIIYRKYKKKVDAIMHCNVKLRALGLLLADDAPTVGWGKTFWRVGWVPLTKTDVTRKRKVAH